MPVTDLLILFFGALTAAALSGSAGFGGALLLLPLLTRVVGPELAVPLLTLAQIVGNASRVWLGFHQIRWRPVGLFLSTALPGAVLGALCFVSIPRSVLVRSTGAAILVYVLLRLSGRLRLAPGPGAFLVVGGVSGFLSGLVGSSGPLGSAVFLSLDLPPLAYVASDAMTSLLVHLAKTATYQSRLHFSGRVWLLAGVLGAAMILGTWLSRWLVERMPPERFRRYVTVLLGAIATQMLVCG